MKRLSLLVLALSVVALAAPDAWAQRGGPRGFGRGGGGGDFGLLQQKSVQDELKLSQDQIGQATGALEKQRESMGNLRDLSREERQQKFDEMRKANQEAIAKILSADQVKRLKQIALQQRGPRAFGESEVADTLGLSSEQKQKIESIQEEIRGQMQDLFQAGPDSDREAMRKKMESVQSAANEKLQALLTPEQQTKWKDLLGEPFKGEIVRPQFRGDRGGAGGGRRERSTDASSPRSFMRLVSFRADEDDDDNDNDAKADKPHKDQKDGDNAAAKSDAQKDGKEGKHAHKSGKAAHKKRKEHAEQGHHRHSDYGRDEHARRGHGHGPDGPAFSMRHGGGPHAEIWSRVARALGEHPGWHDRPSPLAHHGPGHWHGPHPGNGQMAHGPRFGPHRGGRAHYREHFVHHGEQPFHGFHAHHRHHPGHGPDFAHHRGGHDERHWAFEGEHRRPWEHGAAPLGFGRGGDGDGPEHLIGHHGPHHHRHHFASWRKPEHGQDRDPGPGHFDRLWPDGHGRPPTSPRDRDGRRSEATGPQQDLTRDSQGGHFNASAAVDRLAQLEQSLELLAEQIADLRQSLRR